MTSTPERHMIRPDRMTQLFGMRVTALIVRDGRPPAAEILKETL
jgi:hypothetical protein